MERNNSEEGATAFEPELLPGICFDWMVCGHTHVAFPAAPEQELHRVPRNTGHSITVANSAKFLQPLFITNTRSPGKAVLSWAPQVSVLHGSTALLPPGLEPPPKRYQYSLETGAPYSEAMEVLFKISKTKPNPRVNPTLISL